MNTEHDEFARRHPSLDGALRRQIQAPVMDAAFRRQVMARVAAQRIERDRVATEPARVKARLRAQLVLQVLNIGAVALAAVLLIAALAPQLSALPRVPAALVAPGDWLQQAGLVASFVASGAALVYGLQHARLLGWLRTLGI